jgi:hypothetical protein
MEIHQVINHRKNLELLSLHYHFLHLGGELPIKRSTHIPKLFKDEIFLLTRKELLLPIIPLSLFS